MWEWSWVFLIVLIYLNFSIYRKTYICLLRYTKIYKQIKAINIFILDVNCAIIRSLTVLTLDLYSNGYSLQKRISYPKELKTTSVAVKALCQQIWGHILHVCFPEKVLQESLPQCIVRCIARHQNGFRNIVVFLNFTWRYF